MATNKNKLTLHRKEWQMMTPSILIAGDGAFVVKDPLGERRSALMVTGITTPYLYDTEEDAWETLPTLALTGTFGAGACGAWTLWSITNTASGGSTTQVTYAGRFSANLIGREIKFMSGSNVNLRRTITAVSKVVGGTNDTNTITLDSALPNAVINGDTFQLTTGRYFVVSSGTLGASGFKSYDIFTGTITTHSVTGLPATWGTDGRLVATPSYVGAFATGTATAGTSTTISNSAKTWTTNQWSNYAIRITSGTGVGQVRYISSNTGTQITVSSAWTTTPDSTSVYSIEGNDDFLYLLGNGAVTMYRYNITANTWTTLSPTSARATAPALGMSANWVGKTENATWSNESNIQDGRYIYSFQGGSTGNLHRYDIALNTWETINYLRQAEAFGGGSSYDYDNGRIYIQQGNGGRFFYLDIVGNQLIPWGYDFYPQSTARAGDKMFTVAYNDGSGDIITWVYYICNNLNIVRRCMVFDKG
jgi:hypothetical protein